MLRDLSQPVELCDESGRVLGHLFPTIDSTHYEGLEPQITKAELKYVAKKTKALPTQQRRFWLTWRSCDVSGGVDSGRFG